MKNLSFLYVCLLMILSSCNLSKKSLYISNRLDVALTLMVPNTIENKFFNNSKRVIYIPKEGRDRKLVIYYDKTKWTYSDKQELNNLLMKSKIVIGKDTIATNQYFKLKRIALANELFLKIVHTD
ncbi:hypothetical protein FBD94_09260 [Pedobacter hiemivivus]|uniref:Uncharacterized protein n=1 Tax=Pedobacter hiemivivus TaxID=2530454 RepID=A0A4R0N465_9SPHI|nr:hypothetical protein [Pedobacter hiemivivus]TCC94699.1 hypothetical protein EZ444_17025 [Pedobacter hiemivivus]TKC62398.1 hypothetical protein FBD94_09260 [Pedobacter hiemivivus]